MLLSRLLPLTALLSASLPSCPAAAAPGYQLADQSMAGTTVVLTGRDLTVEQVVAVARHGAHVRVDGAARRRMGDTAALMTEGAAENVPIYLFNRAPGAGREQATFTGDPMSVENRPRLEARALAQFRAGALAGAGPEVESEEAVRAMMVVRANTMTWLPASQQLLDGLVNLLNQGVTPVARTIGGTGEADGPMVSNVNGVLVGRGEAWLGGRRMAADAALAAAGLKPIAPAPGDWTVGTTNADYAGESALLVSDAQALLDWADLCYAMDLTAMNSSVTPLFMPVQRGRPYPWLNWQAARVLGMIRGGYLLDADPARIIQDPESLRASAIRDGAAWTAWARLRDTVTTSINWTDHNPVIAAGVAPGDAWELQTSQAMRYRVRGGPANGGKQGFIFSNANWDPYPLDNDVEAFTNALANMDVTVALRMDRFTNTFFTVVKPGDVLPALAAPAGGPPPAGVAPPGVEKVVTDLWQEVQGLAAPVPASGMAIQSTVEDLQAQTRLKVARARLAVDRSMDLLAQDLLTATYWLDIRHAQDPKRAFGAAPTAAWTSFRQALPFQAPAGAALQPPAVIAGAFIRSAPAARFMPAGPPAPR